MLKKTYRILIETCLAILLLLTSLWFVITQPIWTSKPSYHHTGMTVNPNTLRAFVETLSRDLPPRIAIEDQLLPTVKWIETQLKPYGMTQRQTYEVENESFHNIVLTFGEKTAETIVVGAHYDTSHGLAGADDNASGVAGLIELARLLAQTKNLSTAIELVFYPLEEKPYFRSKNMGSYRHAKRLKTAGRQVKLMLLLEMIGYFSDEPNSQQYPIPYLDLIYPNKGNFIAIVGNIGNMMTVRKVKKGFRHYNHVQDNSAKHLPVYSINAPAFAVPGIDFSDHRNYWAMDYPVVMITDTAFARNVTKSVETTDFSSHL